MPRRPGAVIVANSLLRAARARLTSPSRPGQRMSRAELADAVNAELARTHPEREASAQYVDFRWVGKLERGEHRWPSVERRAALRRALGVSTDSEIGLFSPRQTAEPVLSPYTIGEPEKAHESELMRNDAVSAGDLRRLSVLRMAGAAWFGMLPEDLAQLPGPWAFHMEVPARVEMPHVEALRRSITLFEEWDHQYGGGLARAAMGGQLEWVCRTARISLATESVHREWLSTAARLGDLVGWACFDAGEPADIVHPYFITAIQLAGEAENVQQRAHTATSISRYLSYHGKAAEALEAAELARLGWRHIPPPGRAVISIVEARAHAKQRDAVACLKSVSMCDEQFARSRADAAQDLTWGYYADAGQILGDAGHAMFDLALATGYEPHLEATVKRLTAAYVTHPITAARSKALTMIRVACLEARRGNLQAALDAAQLGVADARGVQSHRIQDDLRILGTALTNAVPLPETDGRLRAIRAEIDRTIGSAA